MRKVPNPCRNCKDRKENGVCHIDCKKVFGFYIHIQRSQSKNWKGYEKRKN